MCFTAGQQDKAAPILICVHRGRHSIMQDFVSLEELNQHMSTCFTKHEELVLGKCSLSGTVDFPAPRDSAGNKKGKKE